MVRLRLGGASHRPWTGGLIALTLVGVHLTRSLERSIEVRLMALATAVGAIGEMVRIATVTYRFTSGTVIDALPPAWLLTTATKVRARRPSETGDCRPILDSSPRVCPESSPTIASFPPEFGKCDGLNNRRLSLFLLRILAGTRRHRAQCARDCARCREAHPRLRATPQSTHALDKCLSRKCMYFVYLKVRGEVAERLKAAVC